jgi:branched-chain amino acid transport system ATP-binding protein/neutral amino acid transport system ATP-binding protein
MVLAVENIVAGYGAAERTLKDVSIHVGKGEIVTIIGPNGAGKSTLLKTISGLVRPTNGRIALEDVDVTQAGPIRRTQAGISFVPQERNVFGKLSVAENIAISTFLAPSAPRARAIYERFPLLAERRNSLARTLSGGQRQILAIAMGLVTQPRLLLLDEPTAGLSPRVADELFETIVGLNAEGLPILMVEQHAIEALSISKRGYVLVAGQNAVDGPGPDLAAAPEIRRLFLGL